MTPRAADVAGVVAAVAALSRRHRERTRWVGIDGCGAAGKTSLATVIATRVPAVVVVHVDDFAGSLIPEWDWGRLNDRLVAPLLAGRAASYRGWDWARDTDGSWHRIAPGHVVVVEGVSATRREVRAPWDLTVWVEAPLGTRLARARERDGEAMLTRWLDDWMPSERRYIAREHPAERVDLVVDGTA